MCHWVAEDLDPLGIDRRRRLSMDQGGAISFLFGALALYAGIAGLGAWIGVEIRGLTLRFVRASTNSEVGGGISEKISPQAANPGGRTRVGDLGEPKGAYVEAICCPHCGAASIDWWDKLMSGLIGRHCVCENCGKSSREERKQRLVTSIAFLGVLWLVGQIPNAAGVIAIAVWAILFVVVEWRYIYEIPLVPVVGSEPRKKIKDMFAWGFIGLILATFVTAAIFNSL